MDAALANGINQGLRYSIDDVYTMLGRWNNEEKIYGETDRQYATTFHYAANVYSFLIAKAIITDKVNIETAFKKFDYFNVRKCFSCKGIDINKYLEAYSIDVQDINPSDIGIESIEEESTLQVEGSNVTVSGNIDTLNVLNFVNGSQVCTLLLDPSQISCTY